MSHRSIQLIILGFSLVYLTKSATNSDSTTTNQLLCHSCKGNDCQEISNDENNVITCNRHTQLCWAGFVDQQPYRTCGNRFCTPNGISLENDIRIETCCHSNLCNNLPLSWSIWSKWYRRTTTRRPETSPVGAAGIVPTRPPRPTEKRRPATTAVYVVHESLNNRRKPASQDSSEERDDSLLSTLQLNASNPASFGINWDRVPYNEGFSMHVVSISKLLILIMPIVLVLLF